MVPTAEKKKKNVLVIAKTKVCVAKIILFWSSINLSWKPLSITRLSEDECCKLSHHVAAFVAHDRCVQSGELVFLKTSHPPACWICSVCSHTQHWQCLKPGSFFEAVSFETNAKLSVDLLKMRASQRENKIAATVIYTSKSLMYLEASNSS